MTLTTCFAIFIRLQIVVDPDPPPGPAFPFPLPFIAFPRLEWPLPFFLPILNCLQNVIDPDPPPGGQALTLFSEIFNISLANQSSAGLFFSTGLPCNDKQSNHCFAYHCMF